MGNKVDGAEKLKDYLSKSPSKTPIDIFMQIDDDRRLASKKSFPLIGLASSNFC
jgi:hypothetical protein